MEKSTFENQVRQKLKYASRDTLSEFILNTLKYIPHDSYEETIALLIKEYETKSDITGLLSQIRDLIESVKAGDYSFSWEVEEEYYDGYGGYYDGDCSDNEVLSDDNGLGSEVEQLLKAAMNCVVNKNYSIAGQAFELLLSIEIPGGDYDDIDVKTLFEHDFVKLDYKRVLEYYAYAVLMSFKDDKKIDKLFKIEKMSGFILRLDEILTVGIDEIPDKNIFIKEWIEFLRQKDINDCEPVIIDAIKYKGGVHELEQFILEFGLTYQGAYIELINIYMLEEDYKNAARIIQDGLFRIKGVNANRTVMSDLLTEIGKKINNESYLKRGIEEGFYSSIDLKHFLRLYDLNDNDVIARAVNYFDEQSQNQQKKEYYHYIHFLYGDYDSLFAESAKDKDYLGWSDSIKGQLLPIFMALLSGEDHLKPCIRKLIAENYVDGSSISKYIKDYVDAEFELFAEVLCRNLRKLSDEEYDKYFKWCAEETAGRVKVIVGGQYRYSYYKASAMVVAMGEVLISRGDRGRAIDFIKSYKREYSRYSAFHKCLREDLKSSGIGNI